MAEDKKPLVEVDEKSSEMKSLIKSLKDSTDSNKAESETIDMQMFLEQFKDSMKVGDTNIKALKVEFEKANEILNNQSSEATEKEDAQKTIDAIKTSVESEEEKREKQKAQDEANSILNKMSGKLDSVAKGLDGFVSNAIGAGGLLAAAMLFIDPEKLFDIIGKLINDALVIIGKISNYFKEKILPKLEDMDVEVDSATGLIGLIALYFSGTIIRTLSGAVKTVKKLVTAAKTFGTFIKTSFVGNMISNLATTTKNFMSAGISKLKNAAIAFKGKMLTEFIPNMLSNLKSMMASLGNKVMKALTGLKNLAIVFKAKMLTEFIPSMLSNLKSMMSSLGGKVISLMNKLVTVAKGFRVMMLTTFIPSMIAAFTGMTAAMTPILVALAPILVPILAIAAAFGLVLLGLNKIKEQMGFTSIFDVVEYGMAHVKDGLARFGNFFIMAAKKIADLASGALELLGIEVPEFLTDLSNAELLSTDNAAKKKVELQEKAIKEAAQQTPNLQSDVLATSQENAQAQSGTTTQAVVTSVTQQNNASSSSSSSTIINPTGNSMAAMELAGATGGRR